MGAKMVKMFKPTGPRIDAYGKMAKPIIAENGNWHNGNAVKPAWAKIGKMVKQAAPKWIRMANCNTDNRAKTLKMVKW